MGECVSVWVSVCVCVCVCVCVWRGLAVSVGYIHVCVVLCVESGCGREIVSVSLSVPSGYFYE